MYSIIDSCDETSGWHLPGLANVKETALSFVAQTSRVQGGGNLAGASPAGLNSLRCHRVLLAHHVDCTTERCQEREFLLSRLWLAPWQQWCMMSLCLHVSPNAVCMKLCSKNRLQLSGLDSWSRLQPRLKKQFVKPQSSTENYVCDVSSVWALVSHIICRTDMITRLQYLHAALVCFEFEGSDSSTNMHVFFCKRKPQRNPHEYEMKTTQHRNHCSPYRNPAQTTEPPLVHLI